MIRRLFSLFVFVVFSLSIKVAKADGYELKIKIKNLANKDVILGHHFADKLYPDDTLKLDNTGHGILKGGTKFPEGIYFLMTPSHNMFDFFMTEKQSFSIENDTINLFENLKFKDSPENTAAWEYRKFMVEKQKESNELQEKKKKTTDAKEIKLIDEQLKQIGEEFKSQIDLTISSQKDNFVGTFIKATQEVNVPEPPKDANGKVIDPTFQYRYYRSHYFDNINLKDPRFLRCPIADEKIKKYLDKVVPQIPDTINMECDKLLTLAEGDKDIFRYMLVTLFNYYATSQIMGFDAVYAHLAEKWYIPKANFSDTAFIRKTKETVTKLKPLLIGKTPPDLRMLWVPTEHFVKAQTDTAAQNNPHYGSFISLSQIEAKYTILVFWESDCGHCKKTIPEIYEVYQRLRPKGVALMAVHMLGGIEGKQKWIKFVNEHQMYDWYNVWNPYDFSYKKAYDITSTPVIFILDKDKKIIGKKLDPKQIEEYLNALMAEEKKTK